MEIQTVKHWTHGNTDAFVSAIAWDFAAQLETKLEKEDMNRKAYAKLLDVHPSRVSQMLNDPTSFNLRSMVKSALVLGMKVSVVVYEDGDSDNKRGPINSQVFATCWEYSGSPRDLSVLAGTPAQLIHTVITAHQNFYRPEPVVSPVAKPKIVDLPSLDLLIAKQIENQKHFDHSTV